MEVRIVMRFFFPYTPWAGILRKVPFPPHPKLNYVRFENLCVALFFYPCFFLAKTDCRLVQHAFFRAPQRLSVLNSFDRMQ
ncbi:hypothetical protein N7501_006136 [Penicillium viridicatum]|nr:hypothetical protein N7501_006136 [Penicillium viridicatum]